MRFAKFVILAILVISAFYVTDTSARKRETAKTQPTTPNYQLDPEVLKEHQEKFGEFGYKKQMVPDNTGRLRHVNAPYLSKPSLVLTDPGKKIGENEFQNVESELPVVPNFPGEVSTLVRRMYVMGDFVGSKPCRKYHWGMAEPRPAPKKYGWGQPETLDTKTEPSLPFEGRPTRTR